MRCDDCRMQLFKADRVEVEFDSFMGGKLRKIKSITYRCPKCFKTYKVDL